MISRSSLTAGVAVALAGTLVTPAAGQTSAEQRLATLHRALVANIDQAQRVCVGSASRNGSFSLSALLEKLAFWQDAPTVNIRIDQSDYFGAARDLPAALQRVENVDIRKCMEDKISPTLAIYNSALATYASADSVALISVRFNFARKPGAGAASRYTDNLLISTFKGAPLVKKNLAINDDPVEGRYYEQEFAGSRNEGVLVPRLVDSQVVSGGPPLQTRFCIEKTMPPPRNVPPYDRLICNEGGSCTAHPQSAGNTRICRMVADATTPGFRLAAAGDDLGDRHWEVPSIDTLTERGAAVAGGYTLFNIDSTSFDANAVKAVEFALSVNGVPVWEDGLAPNYQPMPLARDGHFRHDFALQQLNFRGAHSGCEFVDVTLRPIFVDGQRGAPRTARLRYVLLRDALPEVLPMGDGALTWRATTIRPAVADRNFIIVRSYAYPPGNETRRAAAAAAAEADRQWVDSLNLRMDGDGPPIIAAVRPPHQLDKRGLAAYGLILGVVEPSGQVRLSWSPAKAQALGRYVVQNRPNTPRGRDVFGAAPYAKAAPPGTFNLPGVCPIDTAAPTGSIADGGA